MNLHKNAKHTRRDRERLVRLVLSGLSPESTPHDLEGSAREFCANGWRGSTPMGVEGLVDRSSRPHHLRAVTPEPVVLRIIALRRLWHRQQKR